MLSEKSRTYFPTNGDPFLWGVKTLATLLLWADLVPCGVAVKGDGLFLDVFARGVYMLSSLHGLTS